MLTDRSHRPVHGLLVAAVSATLAAVAALCLMGGIELTTPRTHAATPPGDDLGRAPADAQLAKTTADRILSSSLFAPEVASATPPAERARPSGATATDRCDTSLRLVATVAARSSSLAAIRAAGEPVQIVRIGATLRDGTRVATIEAAAATLARPNGVVCTLALFRDTSPARPDDSRPPPTAADELGRLVRQVGPDEYELSRELVERTLRGPADLRGGRYVIPHEVGGRVMGVRIFGVRAGGLLGRIGLRNGDVLRTINGYALADPYDALEAYARLTHASELALTLDRDGQPRTLRYHVR